MHSGADPNVTKTVTTKKLRFVGCLPPLPAETWDQSTPRDTARVYFLLRVAALERDVLRTLRALDLTTRRRARWREVDDAALAVWAADWHLAPWVLAYARETLRLWRLWPAGRGRAWSPNPDDAGALVPDTGRRPKRPTALLIPRQHFDYLVRARIKRESLGSIARDAGVRHYAVSTAIRKLAATLDRNAT